MEKIIYYLNSNPVAEFENGEYTLLDPEILLLNKHEKITCSSENDNNIKLVHHLHVAFGNQTKNNMFKKVLNDSYDESI